MYRAAIEKKAKIDFVAVNDITDAKTLAHLLKYDSVHGRFNADVQVKGNNLAVNGKELKILSQRDPAQLPWKDMGVYLAVESTGLFTDRDGATKHITAGAKKVLISAPAKNPDATIVLGVNQNVYDHKKHNLISNASCTTNCVAPVTKVLHESFGVERAFMMTAHAYTSDQRVTDLVHKDLRRARAAALNIIPTTTGAAAAIGLVIPELAGKMDGISTGSSSRRFHRRPNSRPQERGNKRNSECSVQKAADGSLKGILEYTEEPIVSTDVLHSPYSAVFDALSTMVLDKTFVKVLAWYDNEWGFSCRMVEQIEIIGKKEGLI